MLRANKIAERCKTLMKKENEKILLRRTYHDIVAGGSCSVSEGGS